MNKHSYLKYLLFAMAAVFLSSCDNDFNELGTDIVGIDNFNLTVTDTMDITATNLNVGAVETKNLATNPLGIYDNPVYGKTRANFATQLQLGTLNPTFDPALHQYVQSVVLTIPYFNTKLSTAADGAGTYELDSIYGSVLASKMKLSIYESGYFIRDVNAADQLSQPYYSDQDADFDNAKLGDRLNNTTTQAENDQFFFDKAETVVQVKQSDSTTFLPSRGVPSMKINLSKQFFVNKIINAPAGKLLNNNVFKDYFRGLYFKVEQNGSEPGNLAMLNFAGGKITITYREDESKTSSKRVTKTLVLNLTGNTVSLIDQGNPYVAPDDSRLFLKGGANNSMVVVDLFSTGQLAQLKAKNWLINDAALTFTIDRPKMDVLDASGKKAPEPLRLYLYDLTNKQPLIDYALDASANANTTKFNKKTFGGIIEEKKIYSGGVLTERYGVKYKIRITKHLINMIKLDSSNVRLGLVVTENINDPTNRRVKNQTLLSGKLKVVPSMSVLHPLGTVLYGSNIPEGDPDYDKRPKFEIYYTQPK